jgi:hypothetical protein
VAPLLRFLDREHLGYDLTTDLALEAKQGPSLGNAPGVAFAGSATWLPADLQRRLRAYVEQGGWVASFGVDAFRRPVTLTKGSAGPSPAPSAANAFGERTARLLHTDPAAPLVVESDRLNLFAGGDRFVGDFSLFEPSAGLSRGTDALTAAGRDPGRPDFVAYRLGKGTVIRAGTPQWAARGLSESSLGVEVPRAMRRIWTLLARGSGTG